MYPFFSSLGGRGRKIRWRRKEAAMNDAMSILSWTTNNR